MTRRIFSSSAISAAVVLQPAGGVDEQDVGALALRAAVSASKASPAASAPGARATTGGAGALAPDLELLDGGGAEGVAGRQHHAACPRARKIAASLPMVVVLPEPLTPTTRMTKRLRVRMISSGLRHRRQHLLDLGRPEWPSPRRARSPCRSGPVGQRRGDAAGGVDAEIGADQHFLDLLERARHRACAWRPGRRWRCRATPTCA